MGRDRAGLTWRGGASARGELRRSEIILALSIVDRAAPRAVGQHLDPPLYRRPRRHLVVPAFDRGVVGEVDVAPLGTADPRKGDDVGHAVYLTGEPMRLRKA